MIYFKINGQEFSLIKFDNCNLKNTIDLCCKKICALEDKARESLGFKKVNSYDLDKVMETIRIIKRYEDYAGGKAKKNN